MSDRVRTVLERLLLVVLGVVLETLATPPGPAAWLVFVQDVPFLLLLWHRGGAHWKRWAYAYAFVRYAVALRWLAQVHPGMVVGAAAILALAQLGWGAAIRALVRRRVAYVPAVAVTAVLLEMAQTVIQGASGMPWPARSLAFAGWPVLRAAAALFGAYGLSALAAATAAWASGLPGLLRRDEWRIERARRLISSGIGIAAVVVVLLWNGFNQRIEVHERIAEPHAKAARTAPLVVVQASIEQSLKNERMDEQAADAIFDRHVALTADALATLAQENRDALAVLWPETMIPTPFLDRTLAERYPGWWEQQHRSLLALKRVVPPGMSTRFLLGVNEFFTEPGSDPALPLPDQPSSDTVLFVDVALVPEEVPDPSTWPAAGWPWELGRHDKVILVPWGEYAPGGSFLPFLRDVRRAISPIAEITPGPADQEPFLLALVGPERPGGPNREVRAGTVVCFEIAFPARCRDWRRRGATVLLNAGNYAWYGDTEMPAQVKAIAQLRAAELAVTVVVAGNTGPTCVIDPSGDVRDQVRREGKTQFVAGWLAAPLSSDAALWTLYARWGDVPWWIAGGLLVLWAVLSGRSPRRTRPGTAADGGVIDPRPADGSAPGVKSVDGRAAL